MQNYKSLFGNTPPVVKNLLIINILMLLFTYGFSLSNIDLVSLLGLHFIKSPVFQPYQIVTHMFMHGGLMHLFFNMFALWMFGRVLENVWGPKRFFIFYFVCGLGAAFLHLLVEGIQYESLTSKLSPDQINLVIQQGTELLNQGRNYSDSTLGSLNLLLNIPTIGASGAIFGVLLGFGMLFPNTELMLLFPPIPIKAKYFVMGYGALELYLGLSQPGSDIAHFAHLGGMLFGYLLIKYWNKKDRKNFY